jgi:hypothetical protein
MKRLKRILKWTGIVLGVLVAIILVVNACLVWITGTRLDRQLAAIREAGGPLSVVELARPPIPPEQNAATYLRRAATDAAAIDKELWEVPEWKDYTCGQRTYPVPRKVQRALEKAFGAYPRLVPLLEQAAACPDYDARLDYTVPLSELSAKLSNVAQEFRDYARALACRSLLMVAEGNRDEAVRSALVILRLANHLDRNPLVLQNMVAILLRGIAIDAANFALQTGPISKEVRAALDGELTDCERTDNWRRALKNDRALCLEAPPEWIIRNAWPGRSAWLVGRPLWNWRTSDILEAYSAAIPLLEGGRSYRDDLGRIQEAESALGFFGRECFSGLVNARKLSLRMRAMVRSLRVLSALQTHVPKGSSKIPRLGELGLPVATTTDPFNGELLHVKRLPEGWLIYSVGEDLTDDGGKLLPCSPPGCDYGVAPPPPTKSP